MFLNNMQLGNFGEITTMGALGDKTIKVTSPHMKGDDVFQLQNLLIKYFSAKGINALPKYGADGDFGSEGREWVEKFQADKGMAQSGQADSATISALKSAQKTGVTSVSSSAIREPSTTVSNATKFSASGTKTSASKPFYMDTMNQVYIGVGVASIALIAALAMGGKKGKRATA